MIVGLKCICGSIIHAGHVVCLRDCKMQCNYLICLTQPDNVIEELKGAKPPIPLEERIIILDSIRYVDEVAVYYEKTEDKWLKEFQYSFDKRFPGAKLILFHSEELKGQKDLPGINNTDEIIFIPRRYLSTSEIIDKIIRGEQWKKSTQ